jgi:hypothetical protein
VNPAPPAASTTRPTPSPAHPAPPAAPPSGPITPEPAPVRPPQSTSPAPSNTSPPTPAVPGSDRWFSGGTNGPPLLGEGGSSARDPATTASAGSVAGDSIPALGAEPWRAAGRTDPSAASPSSDGAGDTGPTKGGSNTQAAASAAPEDPGTDQRPAPARRLGANLFDSGRQGGPGTGTARPAPLLAQLATPTDASSGALWLLTSGLAAMLLLVGAVGVRRSPLAARALSSLRAASASWSPPSLSKGRGLDLAAVATLARRQPPGLRRHRQVRANGRRPAPLSDRPRRSAATTAGDAVVAPPMSPPVQLSPEPPTATDLTSWSEDRDDLIACLAAEPGVDSAQLRRVAWHTAIRALRAEQNAIEAEVEARLTARLAGWLFCAIPLLVVITPLLAGGSSNARLFGSTLGWLAPAAATALTVTGVRWASGLARSEPRLLGARQRVLHARHRWADEVARTVETAQLYAAAGWTASDALRAASPKSPDHPVRRALVRRPTDTETLWHGRAERQVSANVDGVDDDMNALHALVLSLDRASDAPATADVLDRASTALRERQSSLLRAQVRLTTLRTVGPLLACFLPAAGLLLAVNLS